MNLLISGGNGFIGKTLAKFLQDAGHQTFVLSRTKGDVLWNPTENWIQENAFKNIDAVIHLAGENIGEIRWTAQRKKVLIQSRKQGTEVLVKALNEQQHHVQLFISASAIGFYGADTGDQLCDENTPNGSDFLAECVSVWESANGTLSPNIRKVVFRLGLVLDKNGGVFKSIFTPIRFGLGSALGSGKQWQSWIHIKDVCEAILLTLNNKNLRGTYNLVAPNPIRQVEMAKQIALKGKFPFFMPAVPKFVLKLVLGEMACLVLGSNKVTCDKFLKDSGIKFKFPDFERAVNELI